MSLTKPDVESIIRANIWSAWAARRETPLDAGVNLMKLLPHGHENVSKVIEVSRAMQHELNYHGNLGESYRKVVEFDNKKRSCASSEE